MKTLFDLNTAYTETYPPPKLDREEMLRYLGVRGDAPELDTLIDECIAELDGVLIYKVCYRIFNINTDGDRIDLGFIKTDSSALSKNLHGCDKIVLFGATVGVGLDRLIAKYSRISPSKAIVFQSIGAERIEALCDKFSADIAGLAKENGYSTRPRFSPGYGDFPLEAQKDIFAVLDCPRRIGLTLNQSLLMSPSKSVTAIIGLTHNESGA